MTNKNIKLQVWKNNSETTIATQGEVNSRFLTVKIEDENGPIDLTGKKVYFFAKKPDNNPIFVEMTVEDAENGTAVLGLTSQMSAISGFLSGCEIHVISATGDTLIVKEINILVQPSLGICIEESLSELSAFQQMVSDIIVANQHVLNENNPHNVTAAQIGVPSALTDLTGTLPINQGGTGATSVSQAQKNLKIYTNVTQLGLTYPCTMSDILEALPEGSTANLGFDVKSSGITDAPISYGEVSIFYPSASRRLIFCVQCADSGGEFSNFYLGRYKASEQTISWYKIQNGSMVTGIENGGTGATTASAALTALGGVPTSRTINSKALSSDITLTASDIGAAAASHNHSANDITSGTMPISKGGTGATSVSEAQKNLKVYTSVTQLGLTYPCAMSDILNALPAGSTANFGFDAKSAGITDAPISYGEISIFFPSQARRLIFCTQCISSGGEFSNFYIGYYNSSDQTISWYKIQNGSMVTSIENGGTGAATASAARTSLGAASSADIGNVSNLQTTAKTVVGAINEIFNRL